MPSSAKTTWICFRISECIEKRWGLKTPWIPNRTYVIHMKYHGVRVCVSLEYVQVYSSVWNSKFTSIVCVGSRMYANMYNVCCIRFFPIISDSESLFRCTMHVRTFLLNEQLNHCIDFSFFHFYLFCPESNGSLVHPFDECSILFWCIHSWRWFLSNSLEHRHSWTMVTMACIWGAIIYNHFIFNEECCTSTSELEIKTRQWAIS